MINIFYRYNAPRAAEPKLHSMTVPVDQAFPVLQALEPITSELLVEHVKLDQLRNVTRPYPTDKAQRIK